jgi:hypothetical protein
MKHTITFDRGNFIRTRSREVMKMFYRKAIRLWPLFVAAMFIAPGIIGMGPTAAYAADDRVPFRGFYSGTVAMGSNGASLFSGTGIATHLGRSTSEGYVVFTAAPTSCAGGVPNDNYETLTAANGDSFTIVSHDVACPTGPNQYHGSGDWDVVPGSGTGRFTGVTGQGTFDGNSDFNQGVFSMQLTGTISVP